MNGGKGGGRTSVDAGGGEEEGGEDSEELHFSVWGSLGVVLVVKIGVNWKACCELS